MHCRRTTELRELARHHPGLVLTNEDTDGGFATLELAG
jgi:hypothetical protein